MVEAGLYIELFVQFDEGRGWGRTGGVGRIVCASPEKTYPYSCGSTKMNYIPPVLSSRYSIYTLHFKGLNISEKIEL